MDIINFYIFRKLSHQTYHQSRPTSRLIIASALISGVLWLLSSYRHYLLQSNAYDLGIFDQFLWLHSKGIDPYSSLFEVHMLADHGAFILLLLSFIYKIIPGPSALFAIQGLALSFTALPLWMLAKIEGARDSQAWLVCITWWLTPVLFNGNLFDFHPELIALPILGYIFLSLKQQNILRVLILSFLCLLTRDGMVLVTLGISLSLLIKRKYLGSGLLLIISSSWLLFLVKYLYPTLGKKDFIHAASRYSYLGNSIPELAQNLWMRPLDLISYTLPGDNIFYLFILFIPFIFLMRRSDSSILIGSFPLIISNLLSSNFSQKTLIHHYSLPAVLIILVSTVNHKNFLSFGKGFSTKKHLVCIGLCWCLLAKPGFFIDSYRSRVHMIDDFSMAKQLISNDDKVITNSYLAPHLTHREDVIFPSPDGDILHMLNKHNIILLNTLEAGWGSDTTIQKKLLDTAKLENWNCKLVGETLNLCRKN